MTIEHTILGIISQMPCSGYEMKIELESGAGRFAGPISFGSIYPKLEKLEKQGLIVVKEATAGGRPKKIYELTAAGWQELTAWLAKPPAFPSPARDELMLKTIFWASARPEDRATLIEHLRLRRARTREHLNELVMWPENGQSLVSEYGMLVLKYGRSQLEAELAWIDGAIAQLAQPAQPPVQDPGGLAQKQQERRANALNHAKSRDDDE